MRKLKKLALIAFSFLFVLGMCAVPTSAAEDFTVTFVGEDYDEGELLPEGTYTLYQLVAGDVTLDENGNYVGENLTWGSSISSSQTTFSTVDDLLDYLMDEKDNLDTDNLKDILKSSFANIKLDHEVSKIEFDKCSSGLYVLYYQNNSVKSNARLCSIFPLNESTTISLKSLENDSKLKKYVKSTDDEGNEIWTQSAMFGIGDILDFKIESEMTSGTGYYYIIDDFYGPWSINYDSFVVKVTNDGVTEVLDSDYYKAKSGNLYYSSYYKKIYEYDYGLTDDDGDGFSKQYSSDYHRFYVLFDDLSASGLITEGSKITIEYKAKYDENPSAISSLSIDDVTNSNNVSVLNYRNYVSDSNSKHTNVDLYTGAIMVLKKDEDGNALTGAEFTLSDENGNIYPYLKDYIDYGAFIFVGLKEGNYTISETTVPEGYRKSDNLNFTITTKRYVDDKLGISISSEDFNVDTIYEKTGISPDDIFDINNSYRLKQNKNISDIAKEIIEFLSGNGNSSDVSGTTAKVMNTKVLLLEGSDWGGSGSTYEPQYDRYAFLTNIPYVEVINTKRTGIIVPGTGGNGKYIYIAAGAVMIIVSGVYLVKRRRKSKAEG